MHLQCHVLYTVDCVLWLTLIHSAQLIPLNMVNCYLTSLACAIYKQEGNVYIDYTSRVPMAEEGGTDSTLYSITGHPELIFQTPKTDSL